MIWWSAPRMWPGETVAILGGGTSLTREDVESLRGRCRVIAINDAYLLAPFADVLYFCDERWFNWHKGRPEFKAFTGLRVTLDNEALPAHSLHNMGTDGLQLCPSGLATGRNGGIQAINLAFHFGVGTILLLGFDMRPGHWHGGHPAPTREQVYQESMLPKFPAVAQALERAGVTVINCTPGSALDVWPRMRLADALESHQHPL